MTDVTCERFEREVGAWLEDDASVALRAGLEAHAARCRACAALLTDLRRIASDARMLPALAPSRDLWAGIDARIAAPVIPLADGAAWDARDREGQVPRGSRAQRTLQLPTRWLAAAAVLLVALSSGITYLATTSGPAAQTGQWVVIGEDGSGDGGTAHPAGLAEMTATYDVQISELRRVIAERRADLDSTTVATVERSLRVIDDAIAESREALSHDPGSDFLHEQLDRTLARKVELLRALARMPARS